MSIYIKPANGYPLHDPETQEPIPDEGLEVEDSRYWRDWEQCGCCSISGSPELEDEAVEDIECPHCESTISALTASGTERKRCPECKKQIGD